MSIYAGNRNSAGHEEEEEEQQHPDHHVAIEDDDHHGHVDGVPLPASRDGQLAAAAARGDLKADIRGPAVGGLLGRIKQAVAEHPVRLREMNTWEPQGT